MPQTLNEKYAAATARNFKSWQNKVIAGQGKLQTLMELKTSLGIRATDSSFDPALQAGLSLIHTREVVKAKKANPTPAPEPQPAEASSPTTMVPKPRYKKGAKS